MSANAWRDRKRAERRARLGPDLLAILADDEAVRTRQLREYDDGGRPSLVCRCDPPTLGDGRCFRCGRYAGAIAIAAAALVGRSTPPRTIK